MRRRRTIYLSRPVVLTVLMSFVAFLGAEAFPQASDQAQAEFQKAFQAGKKLYDEGEHKEAIIKLLEALNAAKAKEETAEADFYIALCYYALGERENCSSYLKRLFEAKSDKEIEAVLFPAGFVGLFYQIKNEAVKQAPPKPEEKPGVKAGEKKAEPEKKVQDVEKKPEAEKKPAEAAKKPEAIGGKPAAEPQVKKKGKFPWLIVGGIIVVGGVVAVLLLTKKKGPTSGSISVTSNPAGAKVYLDGTDTGLTTACTINNVSPGTHAVKLVKEGYRDYEQSVTVTAGQTANVSATLTANSLVVTSPASGTVWAKTIEYTIQWTTDSIVKGVGKTSRTSPLTRLASSQGAASASAIQSGALRPQSIANVNITLYKGGTSVLAIASNSPNDGSEKWTIPASLMAGADYKIRISCATDANVNSESGAFTISEPVEFVTKWGSQGTGDGQFNNPHGIAVDSFGYVYIADADNHRIQKFTSSGSFVTKWGSYGWEDGQFSSTLGVAVEAPGNILVTSFHLVQKFTSNGSFVTKWGSYGSSDGQLNAPFDIAVDSFGCFYIADNENHRIQKFTSSGSFVTKWGSYGSGDGQFDNPYGVAVDSAGYVYVADRYNHRIQKFTSSGSFVTKWGSYGGADGQFYYPRKIAVDASGYVFTSDGNRIQKFTSSGGFVAKWGSLGSGDGQFDTPYGVAVDSAGFVYVVDAKNHRIQKFRMVTAANQPGRIFFTPLRKR
jgi:hypothetical protein